MINKILTVVGLLMTVGLFGLFVYTEVIYKRPLPNAEKEFEELKSKGIYVNTSKGLRLKKITVNIKSKKRLRFMNAELDLIPFKEKYLNKLEDNKAYIRDSIIDIASNMTATELTSLSGKILFEERIKKQLNLKFKKPILKEIFFSSFVIQ